ncbi:hypothetical protein [Actinophytocola sediminis]
MTAALIAYLRLRRTPRVGPAHQPMPRPRSVANDDGQPPRHNLPAREQLIGRGAEKARLIAVSLLDPVGFYLRITEPHDILDSCYAVP